MNILKLQKRKNMVSRTTKERQRTGIKIIENKL